MDTTTAETIGSRREAPSGHIVMTGQGIASEGRLPVLYAREVTRAGGSPRVYSPFEPNELDRIPEGLPVEFEVDTEDASPLDGAAGLLLPGGGDIDPIVYGHPRHPRTRRVSRERDKLETTLLREALRRDMPVLAICRGFQLLNVQLGGTIEQNLGDNPERLGHDRDMPRAEPVHHVRIKPGSLLEEIVGASEIPVNSHHHQGLEVVADGLEEIAWAGDGTLEAVVSRNHSWVLGVQWHPEVMAPVDHQQMKIFSAFLEATRLYLRTSAAA
ncbi:MAG: gamma-glutamyl-gamma-aminobutyrate hydrolase family protein [Actinomycetota bacterium]